MTAADILWSETRQAWRGLLRRPGYLLLAVLTLALGVATTTSVFSLIDQALLKPLPYPQPERLVTLGRSVGERHNVAAPGYYATLARMHSVESAGMLMGEPTNTNIARGDDAEVVAALRADRGFLQTLGLPLALGRNFDETENRPRGPQAVILAHDFWQRQFGGDPSAVGRSLQVEGRAIQIVGVLPEAFQWPDRFDLLLPMRPDPADTDLSTNQVIVARLGAQASVDGASAEAHAAMQAMLAADAGMSERARQFYQRTAFNALPLMEGMFARRTGNTLWLFFGAAACVLLIATINLASLMLLRALARSHDGAVRAALGAPLARLSLPALAEGVLVGVLGSAAGLLLAWIGLRLLGGLVPPEWLRGEAVSLTGTSLWFALVLGVATALLAAALGVLRSGRGDWARELAGGGRAGWSRQAGRLGRALVVAQVAVAVVLLVGAALFTRSLHKLESVPMGFESRSIATFTLAPVRELYAEAHDAIEQTSRILERLERLPGVERAGASSNLPTASQLNFSMTLPDEREITAQYRLGSPGFLDVFGIPLLTGRGFDERDAAGAEPVAVVSERFARDYLDGEPLGKRVTLPDMGTGETHVRVVGVVGDVRQYGPAEPAPAILYTPLAQQPPPLLALLREFGPLSYAVRLRADALGADERALRDAIREVAPQQPIADLQSMQAVVASTTSQQRLNLLLVGLFAGLALLLASVGLYAVMAVAVAARRHEFGVRAALGAPPARLLRQVLREAGWQIVLGLAIGLAMAMALSRVLQGFLFGVGAADPAAIALVLGVLALAGLLASLVPGLRAARVSPMQALRQD